MRVFLHKSRYLVQRDLGHSVFSYHFMELTLYGTKPCQPRAHKHTKVFFFLQESIFFKEDNISINLNYC